MIHRPLKIGVDTGHDALTTALEGLAETVHRSDTNRRRRRRAIDNRVRDILEYAGLDYVTWMKHGGTADQS